MESNSEHTTTVPRVPSAIDMARKALHKSLKILNLKDGISKNTHKTNGAWNMPHYQQICLQ
jgi:hypothetical protein